MGHEYKKLMDYRDLFLMITLKEIKIKYKQSIMGFLWALLMPLIIISAGILVKFAFTKVSKVGLSSDAIASVAVKSIPWAFFIASIRFSTTSLISNFNLVTKIYFPKIIFPISAVFSQFVDFIVAMSFMLIFLFATGFGDLGWKTLAAPVLVVILIMLSVGFGILLSAANLFFRDVKYIVEVLVTFAIFFTPVFYEVGIFGKWRSLFLLNPVAPVLEGLNGCIVHNQLPYSGWIAYSGVFSVVLLAVALKVFKKVEPLFAEYI